MMKSDNDDGDEDINHDSDEYCYDDDDDDDDDGGDDVLDYYFIIRLNCRRCNPSWVITIRRK